MAHAHTYIHDNTIWIIFYKIDFLFAKLLPFKLYTLYIDVYQNHKDEAAAFIIIKRDAGKHASFARSANRCI